RDKADMVRRVRTENGFNDLISPGKPKHRHYFIFLLRSPQNRRPRSRQPTFWGLAGNRLHPLIILTPSRLRSHNPPTVQVARLITNKRAFGDSHGRMPACTARKKPEAFKAI